MQHFQQVQPPLLLRLDEAATLVSLSLATLQNWAYKRRPAPENFPEPVRICGGTGTRPTLRYRRADLEAWVARLSVGIDERSQAQLQSSPASTSRRGRPRTAAGHGKGI